MDLMPRRTLFLAALALLTAASVAAAGSSVEITAQTELSSMIERSWASLARGDRPTLFYRIARSALDTPDDGLVSHPDGRFLRTSLFVRSALGELRGKGLASWRLCAEPEARGLCGAAGPAASLSELTGIVDRFPNTRGAAQAALQLADRRLEAGRSEEALEILEEALGWELEKDLAARLGERLTLAYRTLGLVAGPDRAQRARQGNLDVTRLVTAFGRRRWEARAPAEGPRRDGALGVAMNDRAVFVVEAHAVRALPLAGDNPGGAYRTASRFAAQILQWDADGDRLFLASRPEQSPWRRAPGRRAEPTNTLFAVEAGRRGTLWTASPAGGSADGSAGRAYFASGVLAREGRVMAVLSRAARGGVEEHFLRILDGRTGSLLRQVFLFLRRPDPAFQHRTGAQLMTWFLAADDRRVYAADARGTLVCLEDDRVLWIREYEDNPPIARHGQPWLKPLLPLAGRLVASPSDGRRFLLLRSKDGSLLSSNRWVNASYLVAGPRGRIWIQYGNSVAAARLTPSALVSEFETPLKAEPHREGFPFGELFVVPQPGEVALAGLAGPRPRTVRFTGDRPALGVVGSTLLRARRTGISAYRLSFRRSDYAVGILPFLADAPPAAAQTILVPWLSSSDARLRRWAADLLRQTLGLSFAFDPDGPENERREQLRALRARLAGEGR